MLIGEYTHSIDAKKRVSLPAKFRKEIGKNIVITHGLDNCLFVYTLKQWEKVALQLTELSIGQADQRGFNRFMLAGAVEIDVDSLGRILIPEFLKEFASLDSKVVFIGVHGRVEIWNDEAWSKYKKQIQKNADSMAEKLGEIGVI